MLNPIQTPEANVTIHVICLPTMSTSQLGFCILSPAHLLRQHSPKGVHPAADQWRERVMQHTRTLPCKGGRQA
jgi:hypothetical protein